MLRSFGRLGQCLSKAGSNTNVRVNLLKIWMEPFKSSNSISIKKKKKRRSSSERNITNVMVSLVLLASLAGFVCTKPNEVACRAGVRDQLVVWVGHVGGAFQWP